jgi:hypothetical protein
MVMDGGNVRRSYLASCLEGLRKSTENLLELPVQEFNSNSYVFPEFE